MLIKLWPTRRGGGAIRHAHRCTPRLRIRLQLFFLKRKWRNCRCRSPNKSADISGKREQYNQSTNQQCYVIVDHQAPAPVRAGSTRCRRQCLEVALASVAPAAAVSAVAAAAATAHSKPLKLQVALQTP
jgi:hypothetical protein